MRGKPHEHGGTPDDEGASADLDLTRFRGTSTRHLLQRLIDDDPLKLAARALAHRDREAYLLSSDRVFFRAAARVAYQACVYGVDGADSGWIDRLIERGIDELLDDDREAVQDDEPVEDDDVYAYEAVMALLDVSAESARRVCVAFNALTFEARQSYMTYTKAQMELAEVAHESGVSQSELREALAQMLLRMLGGDRP